MTLGTLGIYTFSYIPYYENKYFTAFISVYFMSLDLFWEQKKPLGKRSESTALFLKSFAFQKKTVRFSAM